MHRQFILKLLNRYPVTGPEDRLQLARVRDFVLDHPLCFERTYPPGHLTGSAWIVSPDRKQTLLTLHAKINKWLQPGGHADGDPDIFAVARREAFEETGLSRIRPLSTEIFDIDVHLIPARPGQAEHFHYDIRFIFEADPAEPLTISRESKELAWTPLAAIEALGVGRSLVRMVEKTAAYLEPAQKLAGWHPYTGK